MTTVESAPTLGQGVTFPPGFLWGCATAAYQIEGAAREDGRAPSIWDTFSHTPGKTHLGQTGDVACDHYHRVQADVDLMKEMGLKAYRFSIAWPRILPNGRGAVNPKGLSFYSRLVDALLEAGIEPAPTLYHWDLPQTLEDAGGWANRETAEAFGEYAGAVFDGLSDRVKRWITLNEPWCIAHLGYVSGDHAPGHKDLSLGLSAGHTLMVGHGLAVQRFREICPDGQIGITNILSPAHPASGSEADKAAALRWDSYANRWFLDPIYRGEYPAEMREGFGDKLPEFTEEERRAVTSPIDFIGVNYYRPSHIADDPQSDFLRMRGTPQPEGPVTAMDWEIYPEGLTEILCWTAETYGNPDLYVTESGAAFADAPDDNGAVEDEDRRAYLESHFLAARAAMDRGARLRGYFVWSLMDNYEWACGYEPRFGLIHINYETLRRTFKRSAHWYAGVIRRNAV